jgi:hypothetical protein
MEERQGRDHPRLLSTFMLDTPAIHRVDRLLTDRASMAATVFGCRTNRQSFKVVRQIASLYINVSADPIALVAARVYLRCVMRARTRA